MKYIPRSLMIIGALALLGLFIYPMWQISLFAPQYPDGVTMHIYINKIGGTSPGTLQNINILNHYVGMKKIEPDAIPELKYFPFIIGSLAALGLLAALIDRPAFYLGWGLLLVLISILGFYDFYLWEYDYGHDLDANAPIVIPGASFQPPLIGKKLILNFTAYSLPHIGGWLAGVAMVCSFVAYYVKKRIRKQGELTPTVQSSPTRESAKLLETS